MQNEEQKERERFYEELVEEVTLDFKTRQEKRLEQERQWELNVNFLNGNQYCQINSKGELYEKDAGDYYWQQRGVYNHLAPIMETRLSKLSRVSPTIRVRPKTDDDTDVLGADLGAKAIEGLFDQINVKDIVKKVTLWSESCGTGFYKIVWDNDAGGDVGVVNGKSIKQGDVRIYPVSPFEIFPDDLSKENLEDCFSIIHARSISVREIKEKYGVDVEPESVEEFSLKISKNYRKVEEKKDSVIVMERYEKPTEKYPNGRLITVAGGKVLYYGELPYKNGEDGKRSFPFVKQVSINVGGSFFGQSVIERLIPIQRAYNAVKNRKHEFINRLSTGIMMVEDGSIDIDDLEQDGLPPGKVLVYRQGGEKPEMMQGFNVPTEFNDEEEKLISEFVIISGVSDVASSTKNNYTKSGTALEILVEQDNERILSSAENVRNAYVEIAKKIIRLYAQFLAGVKMIRFRDDTDKTHVCYLDKKAVNSDDVYLMGENELLESPAKKKDTLLALYEKGLFNDEDGKIRAEVKEKLLSILGFADLDYQKGISRLQTEKAQKENSLIRKEGLPIEIIDDDKIHIEEHLRYVFSEYDELEKVEKERFFSHIEEHKNRNKIKKEV